MKIYLLSAAVGLLVGAIYALLSVRSPAPPVVALVGLLGMLGGEQAVPVVKRWIAGEPRTVPRAARDDRAQRVAEAPVARVPTSPFEESGP